LSHRLEPPPRSAVSRITAILSTFLSGRSHSVTEMARMTGLPVSTTHRIAVDLASWRLLHRTSDGRYRVGIILRQLGGQAWSMPVLTERGPHVVTDLCEATRRRARLGVLVNGRVRYIERRAGADPVTSFTDSATLPAHATALGKALLAFAPRQVVGSIATHLTAYTPNNLHTPDRLQRALGMVRLTRSALARGELVVGESAVAVPVFGCGGEVVAALELELHDVRADLETCKAALVVAARGLSREVAVDGDHVDRPRLRLLPTSGGSTAAPL
jgi:DNA-binding IclR family transcriptional regulator